MHDDAIEIVRYVCWSLPLLGRLLDPQLLSVGPVDGCACVLLQAESLWVVDDLAVLATKVVADEVHDQNVWEGVD